MKWSVSWTRAARRVTIQNDRECHEYARLSKEERADVLGLLPLMTFSSCWFETSVRCVI